MLAQTVSTDIRDFMIMDVCVGENDIVLPTSPLDKTCNRRRNIRPGEKIPYHLHDYPTSSGSCADRLGVISKDNIPVVRDGVERVVSFYDRGVDHTCSNVKEDAPRFGEADGGKEGGSVQWYDDGYGFIMGSWSPVALSHWRTPLCELDSSSSRRFQRGWVIGPTKVPARGESGIGAFASKIEHGDPALTAGSCPRAYSRSFTAWTRDDVTYKGGARLDSLISSHYARSAVDGRGVGEAQQVERTYWTKEFGLTRWEKWAREGWVHPRNGRAVVDLAESLRNGAGCSTPYAFKGALAPDLAIAAVAQPGVYAERVTSERDSHLWYMTLCRDYTNIVIDDKGGLPPKWGEQISSAYWAK